MITAISLTRTWSPSSWSEGQKAGGQLDHGTGAGADEKSGFDH